MKALIIQHMESEGPGTLGDFLKQKGWVINEAKLYEGCRLASMDGSYDLVVSMGGVMNVYEEEKFPFLAEETEFLKRSINMGIKVFGVCLGAQMIAKACGARVDLSAAKEVGWSTVDLTDKGKSDPIFLGINNQLRVFQWHEDVFNVPHSGALLGYSASCSHQAFRINRAYGFQFHVEVDADILNEWFKDSPHRETFLEYYKQNYDELKVQSELIYSNLISAMI